jgi:hypothetical protein
MTMIERNHNIINFKKDLEHLISIPSMPIFMGCTEKPGPDIKADQNWFISKSTGIVQLNPLVPLEILYGEAHRAGVIGNIWIRHHQEFSRFLQKFNVNNVLEIGAGHGQLCKNYLEDKPDTKWTIIEPNPEIKSSENITVITGMFDSLFEIPKDIDCVVHSHLLEHLYEPTLILQDINDSMEIDGLHIFSIPRIEEGVKRGYANAINFEHTVYLTEKYIDAMLTQAGFNILEKEYFEDHHSIFYATRKGTSRTATNFTKDDYNKSKEDILSYFENNVDIVMDLNQKIDSHQGDVFLFGGHVFSQLLLCLGLNELAINNIIDNDTSKHGKRLYGTGLKVVSPQILADANNPAVILKAGHYNEEIKQGIGEIRTNVTYWE